jgi:hypothetical protein
MVEVLFCLEAVPREEWRDMTYLTDGQTEVLREGWGTFVRTGTIKTIHIDTFPLPVQYTSS